MTSPENFHQHQPNAEIDETEQLSEQAVESPAEAVSREISDAEVARDEAEAVTGEARARAKGLGGRLSEYLRSIAGPAGMPHGPRLGEAAAQAAIAAERRVAAALSETYPRLQRADWDYRGRASRDIAELRARMADLDRRYGRPQSDLGWLDGAEEAARAYGDYLRSAPSQRDDDRSSRRSFLAAMAEVASAAFSRAGGRTEASSSRVGDQGLEPARVPRELPVTVVREWVTETPRRQGPDGPESGSSRPTPRALPSEPPADASAPVGLEHAAGGAGARSWEARAAELDAITNQSLFGASERRPVRSGQ
ncbi:MAG: hypothetical protein KGL39_43695 [Patescibacteria group bacterium]|nr:hypothetical protein [Patescibacteria group bacterium]